MKNLLTILLIIATNAAYTQGFGDVEKKYYTKTSASDSSATPIYKTNTIKAFVIAPYDYGVQTPYTFPQIKYYPLSDDRAVIYIMGESAHERLRVGIDSTTAYWFPQQRGLENQILKLNADGRLIWASDSSGGGGIDSAEIANINWLQLYIDYLINKRITTERLFADTINSTYWTNLSTKNGQYAIVVNGYDSIHKMEIKEISEYLLSRLTVDSFFYYKAYNLGYAGTDTTVLAVTPEGKTVYKQIVDASTTWVTAYNAQTVNADTITTLYGTKNKFQINNELCYNRDSVMLADTFIVAPTTVIIDLFATAADTLRSITDGYPEQLLIIRGTSNTNTIMIDTSSTIYLNGGVPFTIGTGDNIKLIFNSFLQKWTEISRSNINY